MSNMIKAYSVRYDDLAKKTIDTHFRIDRVLEERRQYTLSLQKPKEEGFVEGLEAVVVDPIPSATENIEKANEIIENAKKEAQIIIDEAKKEAERLKEETYQTAQRKGYEEGMIQSKREAEKLNAEYSEKSLRLQNEYDDMVQSLEPQMAQVIASMVEKMTGVIVEDKEDIILYLIHQSMKDLDKSNSYTIRVSNEDYDYVISHQDILLNTIGKEVNLDVIQDASLTKNQCLIETDLRVINCSLDVQLNNLISDLKLISNI